MDGYAHRSLAAAACRWNFLLVDKQTGHHWTLAYTVRTAATGARTDATEGTTRTNVTASVVHRQRAKLLLTRGGRFETTLGRRHWAESRVRQDVVLFRDEVRHSAAEMTSRLSRASRSNCGTFLANLPVAACRGVSAPARGKYYSE